MPGHRLASAHPSGSGMGLAIVKKIIESYGGTILVDPACDQGTAFVLSLPLALPARQEPRGPHLRADSPNARTRLV